MHLNIALGFDENFAPYAAVTMASIMENTKSDVVFYLMHDNISPQVIEKITDMVEQKGHKIKWFNMSDEFANMFTGGWSKAMYYPLAIPKICDEDKILFLDSDTLVLGDLTVFYNQDLDDNYVAAVHDYGMYSLVHSNDTIKINEKQRLSIKEYFNDLMMWDDADMKRYFNSGLLLCNLTVMRQENVFDKFQEVIKSKALGFPDQDCYNIVCHNRIKLADIKYNFMILREKPWEGYDKEFLERYARIISEQEQPIIIHFLSKPWREFEGVKVPYSNLYWEYKKKTPWKSKFDKKLWKMLRKRFFQFRISKVTSYCKIFGLTIFEFK